MNSRIILAVITIAVLSSCSTAYKAQTPDDVYYSPPKQQDSYVRTETQKDRDAYRAEEDDYADDRWLRWRVRNRMRWSTFDDYDWYDYRYGNNYSYTHWNRNNYWSYWSWNRSYNPYCGKVIVINPKNPVVYNNNVRNYVPGTYKTPAYNNSNAGRTKSGNSSGTYRPAGSYNNSNNNSGSLGNTIKKVFNNSNNNSSNNSSGSDSRPTRTYTPSTNSSSGSSSGSSGGSGGGGVSRPSRGG